MYTLPTKSADDNRARNRSFHGDVSISVLLRISGTVTRSLKYSFLISFTQWTEV
jgi:hypothetical protein